MDEKGVREGNILLAQILRGTKEKNKRNLTWMSSGKFKFELLVMVVEQTTTDTLCRKLSAPDAICKTTIGQPSLDVWEHLCKH